MGSERMTDKQLSLARHALGIDDARARGGWKRTYRNRYCVSYGEKDWWRWMLMVARGWATHSLLNAHSVRWADDFFHLTRKGALLALRSREQLCPEDFPALQPPEAL